MSPCGPSAKHLLAPVEVRTEGYNGLDLLTLSSSHLDPEQKSQTKTVWNSDTTQAYQYSDQEFESLRQNLPFALKAAASARSSSLFGRMMRPPLASTWTRWASTRS